MGGILGVKSRGKEHSGPLTNGGGGVKANKKGKSDEGKKIVMRSSPY